MNSLYRALGYVCSSTGFALLVVALFAIATNNAHGDDEDPGTGLFCWGQPLNCSGFCVSLTESCRTVYGTENGVDYIRCDCA
jgi:hypothetical protein